MRIVSQKEMRDIEKKTMEDFHFDESLIVENAGIRGADYIAQKVLPKCSRHQCLFLIGKGNNGADGLAMARHLANKGVSLRCFSFYPQEEFSTELKHQYKMARQYGVKVNEVQNLEEFQNFCNQLQTRMLVVDCLFGTGIRLPLSNDYYDLINYVNEHAHYVVSVDMPTGVEGDSGHIQGNAIQADTTLAIGFPKQGHYVSTGPEFVGDVVCLDVGFPRSLSVGQGDKFLLGIADIVSSNYKRNRFADKKSFGHTLVLGGSHGYTGALVLASEAALKVGAGLVTGATWEGQYLEYISRLIPEVMTGYIPEDPAQWVDVLKNLDRYDCIVIGPGLARSDNARICVLEVLNNFAGPVVLDADALNVINLKEDKKLLSMREYPTLLTPHKGEFARLCGLEYQKVKEEPVEMLQKLIDETNCAVILKGACSFIGFPNGKTYFSYYPNDGMATGGTGDVLAGILGGLLGQNERVKKGNSLLSKYEDFTKTVLLASMVHSQAGKLAAQRLGVRSMTAGSIIESLNSAFEEIETLYDSHLEES